MLNTYPLWKYSLIAAVILFGFVYALPNLYPPDFAIQISAEASGGEFNKVNLDRVTRTLKEAGIEYFGDELQGNNGLIRLHTDDDQLKAKAIAQRALDDTNESYVVALNSAATTPAWLKSIGAQPMKYGLDLRGGVHFLMEEIFLGAS